MRAGTDVDSLAQGLAPCSAGQLCSREGDRVHCGTRHSRPFIPHSLEGGCVCAQVCGWVCEVVCVRVKGCVCVYKCVGVWVRGVCVRTGVWVGVWG